MEQSVTRVSGKGKIARVLLVALLSLIGLTVIGVGTAYAAGPVVKSLTPATGSANGGNSVVIGGSGFGTVAANVTVTFGGVPATSFTVNSGIKITATAPAAANSTADRHGRRDRRRRAVDPADPRRRHLHLHLGRRSDGDRRSGSSPASAGVQVGTVVTVTAAGTWTAGQLVSLGGFTNGAPDLPPIYPIVTGGSGSFTVTNAGATTGTGTGTVSPTPAGASDPSAGGTSVVIAAPTSAAPRRSTSAATPATSFIVNSGTQITATAPAGTCRPGRRHRDHAANSTSTTTPSSTPSTTSSTPTVTGITTVASPGRRPDRRRHPGDHRR